MLRKLVGVSLRVTRQPTRCYSQPGPAVKEKWDLAAGVLIERLPVISRDFSAFEQEYAKMLADIEFENSMKSDHEVRHERDLLMAEKLKKGDMELDLDETVKQTAQDMKDAYTEEFKKFHFASRQTEADKRGDKKSTDRKLDQTLILLTEQQIGNKKFLLLPQGKHNAGETLRDTADRVVKEKCGDSLSVQVYGNAPVGFYKYKYPNDQRNTSVGTKIFFFRAALKDEPKKAIPAENYQWLTKSELAEKLPAEYLKSVHQFVL